MIRAASLVECQSTPGSFFFDSGASQLYVNLIDGRTPDSSLRIYKQASSTDLYNIRFTGDDQIIYMDGVHLEGGKEPLSTRHSDPNFYHYLFAKNCTFKYAKGANGVNQTSGAMVIFQNCVAAHNQQDGFNYKSSPFGGPGPVVIEIDCVGRWNGADSEGTNNGSTMHSAGTIVRVNGKYHNNQDRNVHDIDDCFSWNMGCISTDSQTGNSNFACGVGDSDDSIMWLDGCVSSGSPVDIEANGALTTVYTFDFIGEAVNGGNGTITNYQP